MAGPDDTWPPEAATVGPLEGTWLPDAPALAAPEPTATGRYVFQQGLGRGGMGEVIAAEDQALARDVAVKILRRDGPAARRDFVGEARLTARLDHPGVVPVHDVGEMPDGRPYFAMKRVRGESLAQALRRGSAGSLRQRLELFVRVAQTLAFAHDRGVLHLDIKPDNVMLGPFGEVLVMDWGLAQVTSDGGAHLRGVAGTPRYMAPEQATAGARLDARTDVYSLGALLYELLTGEAPYQGTELTQVLHAVRSGATLRSPRQIDGSLPRDLDAIVRKAMSLRPDDRYPDVVRLLADVEAALDDRPLASVPTPPLERLAKLARRNRSAVRGFGVAGALGLAALTLGTAWWAQRLAASERTAREQLAAAEIAAGDALLSQRQPEDAGRRYLAAREVLAALGAETAGVDLALAEARGNTWVLTTIPLDATPSTVTLTPDHALVGAEGRALAVDRHTLAVREIPVPAGLQALQAAADGTWTARSSEGHGLLLDSAGELVVDVGPIPRPLQRFGDLLEMAGAPPRAWTLTGEEVVRQAPPGVVWTPVGHHLGSRHAYGTVDLRDGRLLSGLHTDLSFEGARAVRDITLRVQSPDGRHWSGDESVVGAIGSAGDHLAYRFGDGQLALRAWRDGHRVIRAHAPADDDDAPVTADGDDQIWGIDAGVLWRLQAPDPVVVRAVSPRTLHVSDRGILAADAHSDTLVGLPVAPRFERILDVDPAPTGWWVIDRGGWVVRLDPEGREEARWPFDGGPSAAVPTADGGLVVGSMRGDLTRLGPTGEVLWQTLVDGPVFDVVGLPGGAVAASTTTVPLVVVNADGSVRERHGEGPGYRLAVGPDGQVVAATYTGALLTRPGSPPVALPGPTCVAVGWAPTGPVTQVGTDLMFWSPDGRPLRQWRFTQLASAMAVHEDHLYVLADDLVRLPLTPTAAGGPPGAPEGRWAPPRPAPVVPPP